MVIFSVLVEEDDYFYIKEVSEDGFTTKNIKIKRSEFKDYKKGKFEI